MLRTTGKNSTTFQRYQIPLDLDYRCREAWQRLLKPEFHHLIDVWIKTALDAEKKGIIKLLRHTMPRSNAFATEKIEPALLRVIKTECHGPIDGWFQTATELEKKGLLRLARSAEPALLRTVGRPQSFGDEPSINTHSWYFPKGPPTPSRRPMGWPVRDRDHMNTMHSLSRSQSDPYMQAHKPDYVTPSWMHDDAHETGGIQKPGGYVVKLKDSVQIQRLKNAERNKGTYKLFGGQLSGVTTTGSVHSLQSIGMEEFAMTY